MLNTLHKMVVSILFGIFIVIAWETVALAQNRAGKTVTSVEVQLDISGTIYQGLQERIEYSVNRVGEKLLISQPVSLLEANEETVTQSLRNVFSKALVGFRTESVNLQLGEHTKILIKLTPLPPLITQLDLDLELKKVAPEIVELTEDTADKVETELNRIFCGLPVAAADWADNIFNLVINYFVEREFPGFTPVFTIEPGVKSRIKLVLNPDQELVSDLNIKYSSKTLPTWLVRAKLKAHQSKFNILKGLPVEFLTHYQPQIEQYFKEYLSDSGGIGQSGYLPTVKVTPGIVTGVGLTLNSANFRTKVEARYFKSSEETYVNIQGYLGYMVNDSEVFARVYAGENPEGLYKVGFQTLLSTNFYGGFEYDFENSYKNFLFNYRFDRGDYLELNLGLDGGLNKALIGFYINPQINLEIVNYDRKYGIQLMYHFW